MKTHTGARSHYVSVARSRHLRFPSRPDHEACWRRRRVGHQWPEPELLYGNAKLSKLRLVDPNEVVVGLGDLRDIVLEGLDNAVLLLKLLLDLLADLGDCSRVQVARRQDLPDLSILLLNLLLHDLDLLLQHGALEAGLLLHVVDRVLELLVQVVPLPLHLVELLLEDLVLPLQVPELLLRVLQPGLGVDQRHLVLLVVRKGVLKGLILLLRPRQGLGKGLLVLQDLMHELVTCSLPLLHVRDILLERLDEVQVVVRDVVVVVLDLGEGPLVLLHQLVDVGVLPLLDLMDLLLSPELQVVPQYLHLLLVLLLQLPRLQLELLPQLRDLLGVLQLQLPHKVLVRQLLLLELLLQRPLVLL
mmetsp:Transcript_3718/g.13048  ORF Transcript_3718/g.13048 Transcript_3718/m.13048 type:complete len:359 (+) Transcript_3718:474-1550(+)